MKSTKSLQINHIFFLTISIFCTSQIFCSQKNKFTTNRDSKTENSPVLMLQELLQNDPSLQSIATSRYSPLLKMVIAEQLIEQKIQAHELSLKESEERARTEEKNRAFKKAQAKAQSNARHFVKNKMDAMDKARVAKLENQHSELYLSILSRSNSLQSLRSPSNHSEYEVDAMSVSNSSTGSMDSKASSGIDPKIFNTVDTSNDVDKNIFYHTFNFFSASNSDEDK